MKKLRDIKDRDPDIKFDSKMLLDIWAFTEVYQDSDKDMVYDMLRKEVRKAYNVRLFGGGSLKDSAPDYASKKKP